MTPTAAPLLHDHPADPGLLGLTGRVAVVTGGSSGIGLATASLLLGRGAAVAIHGRNADRLASAVAQLRARHPGAPLLARTADVLDEDSMRRFAAEVDTELGAASMLVNNAGQGRVSTFASTDDAAWTQELHLKFFSIIRPTRAFLPQLVRQREALGDAAVVCVNSLLARQPEPHMVATSAARAGVVNLVRSLATEFAPQGVRVNGISAGPIKTLAASGIKGFGRILDAVERIAPLRRNVTIEDVGNVAAFLLSDLAGGVTGEITYVDAGFSSVAGVTVRGIFDADMWWPRSAPPAWPPAHQPSRCPPPACRPSRSAPPPWWTAPRTWWPSTSPTAAA